MLGANTRHWRRYSASFRPFRKDMMLPGERARRSHACTTSAGALIQHLSFAQCSAIDQSRRLAQPPHLLGRGHHDIHGNQQPAQGAADAPAFLAEMIAMGNDDQQIKIAVRSGMPTSMRAEQHDTFWIADLHDSLHNLAHPIGKGHGRSRRNSGCGPRYADCSTYTTPGE